MKFAVEWTDGVMFMCTTVKSSYRDFAPGYFPAGSCEGAFSIHLTARRYSVLSSLVRSPLRTCQIGDRLCLVRAYYSLRTATVFLLHDAGRLVRPSERVPSRTLYALAIACLFRLARSRVCLLEKGEADAPVKHKTATMAFAMSLPAIFRFLPPG